MLNLIHINILMESHKAYIYYVNSDEIHHYKSEDTIVKTHLSEFALNGSSIYYDL